VSALGRSLPGDACVPFVQTDVPINPGNSGGPLIDLAGRVVGVNSQIDSQSGGYQGGCLGSAGQSSGCCGGYQTGRRHSQLPRQGYRRSQRPAAQGSGDAAGTRAALDVWRNGQSLGIDVTIARLPEPTAKKG